MAIVQINPKVTKITGKTYLQDVFSEAFALKAFRLKIIDLDSLKRALSSTDNPFNESETCECLAFFEDYGIFAPVITKPDPRVVPLEKIRLAEGLDGKTGDNRDPSHQSLEAYDDLSAIKRWLEVKANNVNTRQVYRKEAERFLLWCTLEKSIAMSSIGITEAKDYLRWLEALGRTAPEKWTWHMPQNAWIGPKNTPRESKAWRPFNSAMSHTSRKMSVTIVRQLFGFLTKTGYIIHNPFDQISSKVPYLEGEGAAKRFADRSFSSDQWEDVLAYFEVMPDSEEKARLAVIFTFGKGLGMRASEMLAARASWITRAQLDGTDQMVIEIIGKGDKARRLPIQDEQIAMINAYLAYRELPSLGLCHPDTPLLASLGKGKKASLQVGQATVSALSRSGLYRILTNFLEKCALRLEAESPVDAARFRAASTHWLRHTFATTALKSMPINIVQSALGHASIGTTSRYLTPEESELARAMKKMRPF